MLLPIKFGVIIYSTHETEIRHKKHTLNLGVILPYPLQKKGVQYPLVGNLLYQVTFFSHLMVPSSHYAVPTSHVTVLLSHLVVSLLFSHI